MSSGKYAKSNKNKKKSNNTKNNNVTNETSVSKNAKNAQSAKTQNKNINAGAAKTSSPIPTPPQKPANLNQHAYDLFIGENAKNDFTDTKESTKTQTIPGFITLPKSTTSTNAKDDITNTMSPNTKITSFTSSAMPAPKIKTNKMAENQLNRTNKHNEPHTNQQTTQTKQPSNIGKNKTQNTNESHNANKLDFSHPVSRVRQQKKKLVASIDWEREDRIRVKAAERDGLITGFIALLVMAMFFGVYMMLSLIFPAISPNVLASKIGDTVISWVFSLVSGCIRL